MTRRSIPYCERGFAFFLYVGSADGGAHDRGNGKDAGLARFDLQYSAGGLSHEKLMYGIDLYGSRVIPLVRKLPAQK